MSKDFGRYSQGLKANAKRIWIGVSALDMPVVTGARSMKCRGRLYRPVLSTLTPGVKCATSGCP